MSDDALADPSTSNGSPVELQLLGRFALTVDGINIRMTQTAQRILARVALSSGCVERGSLASALWPDHPDCRAQANLRGAVWRMPSVVHQRLVICPNTLAFGDHWTIDMITAEKCSREVRVKRTEPIPSVSLFRHDLLPDWHDDWLLVEQERHRQLRLHALEDLAELHIEAGRPLDAIYCALLAVSADPLRESAQGLLLRAHIAAGNRADALDCYSRFNQLLMDELGVEPSPRMRNLIREMTAESRSHRRSRLR